MSSNQNHNQVLDTLLQGGITPLSLPVPPSISTECSICLNPYTDIPDPSPHRVDNCHSSTAISGLPSTEQRESTITTTPDATIVRINLCAHVFHQTCLETWLNDHNTCPLCRRELFTNLEKGPRIPTAADIGVSQDVWEETLDDAQRHIVEFLGRGSVSAEELLAELEEMRDQLRE